MKLLIMTVLFLVSFHSLAQNIPDAQNQTPNQSFIDPNVFTNTTEYRCVKDCTSRFGDGSCTDYGPDFCGQNATCVPNCLDRFTDGTCSRYGQDICH